MKKLIILLTAATLMTSCSDDDEKIIPVPEKDYGMKTYSADLKREKVDGMPTYFNCKQQTFFKFGKKTAVAVGEYGKPSWTTFDLRKKIPAEQGSEKMVDNPDYNYKSNVKDWDMVFTQYLIAGSMGPGQPVKNVYPTGVLLNAEGVAVGFAKYTDSTKEDDIAKAFADLKLIDIEKVKFYENTARAIGANWKKRVGMPPVYQVKKNLFYFIKQIDTGDIYKLRFISCYGETQDDYVFKCEYALIK